MIKKKIYNKEFPGWDGRSNKFGTLILMTCKPSWQYILINFREESLALESPLALRTPMICEIHWNLSRVRLEAFQASQRDISPNKCVYHFQFSGSLIYSSNEIPVRNSFGENFCRKQKTRNAISVKSVINLHKSSVALIHFFLLL
jgi:hypothetical protein